MVFLLPRRLRDKIWPEALPPAGSFNGQTVLVTGATSGLGLAAAIHFARLGASLILTSRSLAAGNAAQAYIERCAGIVGQEKVKVMELEMSRYSSCVEFVSQLKRSGVGDRGLDIAVLNAGLINVDFVRSPEGWYFFLSFMLV
jgi:NAD(P)-dependent dehydrogenase (short-subunit alcohol dehydrogenase family)